jgi:hypothetical protein
VVEDKMQKMTFNQVYLKLINAGIVISKQKLSNLIFNLYLGNKENGSRPNKRTFDQFEYEVILENRREREKKRSKIF